MQPLKKSKNKNGILSVQKDGLYIITNHNWVIVYIVFRKKFKIIKKLSDDFIIKKGLNKLIIAKSNLDIENPHKILEYIGEANIQKCVIVNDNGDQFKLSISYPDIILWNTWLPVKNNLENSTTDIPKWEDIKDLNWEDINYEGNNITQKRIFKKMEIVDGKRKIIRSTGNKNTYKRRFN